MVHDKIKELYPDDSILYYSCIQTREGEERLRHLLEKYGPFNIGVEIGTHKGLSSAVISEYCKRLHCMDIENIEIRGDIWKQLGIDNVLFWDIPSNEQKPNVFKSAACDGVIDFVFVDGDHTYEGACADIALCKDIPHVLVDNVEMPEVMQAVLDSGRIYEVYYTYAMLGENK